MKKENKEKIIPTIAGIGTGLVAMYLSSPLVMSLANKIAEGSVTVGSNLAVSETMFSMLGMSVTGLVAGGALAYATDKVIKVAKENMKNISKNKIEPLKPEIIQEKSISKELHQQVKNPVELSYGVKQKVSFEKIKSYSDEEIGKKEVDIVK